MFSYHFIVLTLSAACIMLISAMPPIQISANVRGKRYELEAETVEEVCKAIEEKASLQAGQYSVLFRGKVLSPDEVLESIGVSVGDTLNIVKGKRNRGTRPLDDVEGEPEDTDIEDSVASAPAGFGGMPGGMSEESLREAMKNVDPEQMKKAMQRMDEMLDSDFVDQYFGDDARLEELRQQMLGNLDQYDKMIPGFREQAQEIAADPEKWRAAMQQARDQILALKKQRDAQRAKGGASPPDLPQFPADNGSEDE